MRIAYLSHTAEITGGGERSLLELMGHVERELGHQTILISPPGRLVEEAGTVTSTEHVPAKFAIMRRTRNPVRLVSYAGRYVRSVARLKRVLRRIRADVLHANSAPAALYGGLAALGTGTPMIWHMRDIQPPAPTFRLVLPLIGRLATRVIAISGAVERNLISFGVPARKIRVIHNAVRPPRLRGGGDLRRELGIGPEAVVIGVIGQMLHRKGQLEAVRAFAQAAVELPESRLVLCGGNLESEYAARVEREVEALGLEDRVSFTGFLRDPGAVYDAIDLLLVPSNQEPFGRVVVEGMFAGKPVVASRVGGIPELVRDGMDGLLVTAGDPAALAEAVLLLANRPDWRSELGRNGLSRAAERFSWQGGTRAEAFATVYEDCLATRRA